MVNDRQDHEQVVVQGPDGRVYEVPREVLERHRTQPNWDALAERVDRRWSTGAREVGPENNPGSTKNDVPLALTHRPRRVLLVNPPWASTRTPSLQLSILKVLIEQQGVDCDVLYSNLYFAELCGYESYQELAMSAGPFVEWVFSAALHGSFSPQGLPQSDYLDYLASKGMPPWKRNLLRTARDKAVRFVEVFERRIPWGRYGVIGFATSMSQNVAALALAKRVKSRYPRALVVFGGANCEGEMGRALHRAYRFVDIVVRGEAEPVIPGLIRKVFEDDEPAALSEVPSLCFWEGGEQITTEHAPLVDNLDRQPIPDHNDYFDQLGDSPLVGTIKPHIQFEASRGCWWGEKNHCTFCGLNALGMAFRRKSSSSVIHELSTYKRRYNIRSFTAVDNILDWKAYRTLLPQLREFGDLDLFFELKVNLNREQARLLVEAGIRHVQPGIESLSTPILRLMKKGTTGIKNVCFLRRCEEFGIESSWNFIYGFPQEPAKEYVRMASSVAALHHLQPPAANVRLAVDRFSPYHMRPEEHGLRLLGPLQDFYYIYNLPREILEDLVFSFEYEHVNGSDKDEVGSSQECFFEAVEEWQNDYRRGSLSWREEGGQVIISDSRNRTTAGDMALSPVDSLVYRLCESPLTATSLYKRLPRHAPSAEAEIGGPAGIERRLKSFEACGLAYEEDGRYLSLGVPKDSASWILEA